MVHNGVTIYQAGLLTIIGEAAMAGSWTQANIEKFVNVLRMLTPMYRLDSVHQQLLVKNALGLAKGGVSFQMILDDTVLFAEQLPDVEWGDTFASLQ